MHINETGSQADTERGFGTGQHVVLRPVLEKDLPELARCWLPIRATTSRCPGRCSA